MPWTATQSDIRRCSFADRQQIIIIKQLSVMLAFKKPSKLSISGKARDLTNTRKHGELSRSIINLEDQGNHLILKESTNTNGVVSLKQSFDRMSAENKSGGRCLKEFKKATIKGKRMNDSKNSKASKSSNHSLAKMKKETGLQGQLGRLIDVVRKLPISQLQDKLYDKLSSLETQCNESDKPIASKVSILIKLLLLKTASPLTQSKQQSKHGKDHNTKLSQQTVHKQALQKQQYQNFMNHQFVTEDLANSCEDVDGSQCSFSSYIAYPNEGECHGHKRLKEEVQCKLKLDLNKLKLGKTMH